MASAQKELRNVGARLLAYIHPATPSSMHRDHDHEPTCAIRSLSGRPVLCRTARDDHCAPDENIRQDLQAGVRPVPHRGDASKYADAARGRRAADQLVDSRGPRPWTAAQQEYYDEHTDVVAVRRGKVSTAKFRKWWATVPKRTEKKHTKAIAAEKLKADKWLDKHGDALDSIDKGVQDSHISIERFKVLFGFDPMEHQMRENTPTTPEELPEPESELPEPTAWAAWPKVSDIRSTFDGDGYPTLDAYRRSKIADCPVILVNGRRGVAAGGSVGVPPLVGIVSTNEEVLTRYHAEDLLWLCSGEERRDQLTMLVILDHLWNANKADDTMSADKVAKQISKHYARYKWVPPATEYTDTIDGEMLAVAMRARLRKVTEDQVRRATEYFQEIGVYPKITVTPDPSNPASLSELHIKQTEQIFLAHGWGKSCGRSTYIGAEPAPPETTLDTL